MDETLLNWAVHLHGHLGPYLVLGLRAGEVAIKRLGREPLHSRAVVYCRPNPPRSCFVDGIQFMTGCTLGKGNVEIVDSEVVELVYMSGEKSVKVRIKPQVIERLESEMKKGIDLEELSRWVMKVDPFIVE